MSLAIGAASSSSTATTPQPSAESRATTEREPKRCGSATPPTTTSGSTRCFHPPRSSRIQRAPRRGQGGASGGVQCAACSARGSAQHPCALPQAGPHARTDPSPTRVPDSRHGAPCAIVGNRELSRIRFYQVWAAWRTAPKKGRVAHRGDRIRIRRRFRHAEGTTMTFTSGS